MAAAGDFSEGIMTNVSSSRRLAHRPLYSLDKMIGVLRRSTENFNYRQKEREADECVLFFITISYHCFIICRNGQLMMCSWLHEPKDSMVGWFI